jgi:Serpentine type 7TM GPCR chemoreceptor Srsx.
MEWTFLLEVVLFLTAISLHFVGFLLLTLVQVTPNFTASQREFLFCLSLVEMLYSLGAIADKLVQFYKLTIWRYSVTIFYEGFAFVWYTNLMTMLTLDRLMAVKLSLRYNLLWPLRKTRMVLIMCVVSSLLLSIFLILRNPERTTLYRSLAIFVWPFGELVFLMTAVVTYMYFFIKIRKNRIRDRQRQPNGRMERIKKGFFVPSLLVTTFLVFWFIPDQLIFIHQVSGASWKIPETVQQAIRVCYALAVISDAFIYILTPREMRIAFKRLTTELRS